MLPIWLIDLLKTSPYVSIPMLVFFGVYKMWCRAFDSPLSAATIIGLLAGEKRRKDALDFVKALRDQNQDDEDPPQATRAQRPLDRQRSGRSRRRRRRKRP